MDGIVNVYKECGFTSHDVVAKLRGIFHMKKIGHTGTLDPDAMGVLPVCVGKATKVCSLLTDQDKTYQAGVRLGVSTDTQDLTGTIINTCQVDVTEEQIREVLDKFVGEIQQIPPMYSAVKVNGKRMYELARQGKEVERKPRKITIHNIQIESMDLLKNEFSIEVTCSKGTYIRTLCHDIGEQLGCGAAMKSLVRTRVGNFLLEEAQTLAEIERAVQKKEVDKLFSPIDSLFLSYPRCEVASDALSLLQNGNKVRTRFCSYRKPKQGEKVRMYDAAGNFYAIYSFRQSDYSYHVVKMFY